MTSRNGFIGVLFSFCLGVSCITALCADERNQKGSGKADSAPSLASAVPVDSERALSANDVIAVTVYGEEDLTAKTIIDKNGMVMLQLLGQVKLSGLTVKDATTKIQQLYDKDYLVNPQVNVIVEQFAARRFSVLGQVNKPGSIDFPQNESVNLLEAIAMAGGYTRLGAPSKVRVRRQENGVEKTINLNAEEMSKNSKKKNFEVLPDDIIYVDERTF
ncbi:MAG TPA: polysaccharide biosynthesis/export family protein [Verrucomicrobiae bacterium]|jgi:polysaccharide export outer membrane protein